MRVQLKKLFKFKTYTCAHTNGKILPSEVALDQRMSDFDASERDSLSNVSTEFTGFQQVFAFCEQF